ncbi:MAG: preprotein translocase subunit SecA [Chitinophagaceae bacterium]|nr:MAG: preprotein translocase subunit SecA [Chitinophagaceae bacterium]
MLDFFVKGLSKLFGNKSEKDVKKMLPIVEKINEEYKALENISHDELRNKTVEFRKRIADHLQNIDDEINRLKSEAEDSEIDELDKEDIYKELDKLYKDKDKELEVVLKEILPEAFAVVKETASRFLKNPEIESSATDLDRELAVDKEHITIKGDKSIFSNRWKAAGNELEWNMLHYDVQLIGGIVLHEGTIAEMATGEGKTLVATLPAYLNGLSGLGVHIITVNDYLAKRDSEWMAPIFEFLGLRVDCIDKYQPHSPERQKAYAADITYGTNNEFGFDYLRDNMSKNPDDLVQKKLHFAMVDEVDSVLIDDARTPLIISGPIEKSDEKLFYELKPRIEKLVEAQKKIIHGFMLEAKRHIAENKTTEKDGGLALLRCARGLPKYKPLIKYLSEPGKRSILLKTENYFMQEQSKNMPLVDEELYFVIEEKNNTVELTEKGIELITGGGEDPDFFIMPDVGGEIAELEKSSLSAEEKLKKKDKLLQDFGIKSERIHAVQQLLKAYTLFEKDVEYLVSDGKVKIVDENTGRVMEGRRYSDGLHQAIESKESVKVEAASQTFATVTLQNFFRMYHKLSGMTGTAETEAGEFWEIYKLDVVVIPTNKPIQRDDMPDKIYKTTKEKFNALIDEAKELQEIGRPVLIGTTSVEVSEVLSRMLKLRGVKHNVLNAKQHGREAEVVQEAGLPGAVTIATNMAGRGTDIKLGKGVKESGGLAILGSERHESRRIDRQLRGRAGRQGDPGSSIFYVSLEDNLMRLFGSDRISKFMDTFGYKDGEVLQHPTITKSIERAQRKVEENNFGRRKKLLEYDDVMNSQRDVIYSKRKNALFGDRLSMDISHTFFDVLLQLINRAKEDRDLDTFSLDLIRYFSISPDIEENQFLNTPAEQLAEDFYKLADEAYKRKHKQIVETAMPVLKRVYEQRGESVRFIGVPFSDGRKTLQIVVELKPCIETDGKDLIKTFEKSISLALIDENWKEHLRQMDELKNSVQMAVYEQKDPLLIYKHEAFNLFQTMLLELNYEMCSFLCKANIPVQQPEQVREAQVKRSDSSHLKAGRDDIAGITTPGQQAPPQGSAGGSPQSKPDPIKVGPKVGRNEPCPCGSGKKYKHCHGK